jgi:hypothetical protein
VRLDKSAQKYTQTSDTTMTVAVRVEILYRSVERLSRGNTRSHSVLERVSW